MIGALYIQGSLACSLLAFIAMFCWLGFSRKERLSQFVIVADRMLMIIILAFCFSMIGFGLGIVWMAKVQVPNATSLNYEAFGGLGIRGGGLLGVTLGWLYALWPILRTSKSTQPVQQDSYH